MTVIDVGQLNHPQQLIIQRYLISQLNIDLISNSLLDVINDSSKIYLDTPADNHRAIHAMIGFLAVERLLAGECSDLEEAIAMVSQNACDWLHENEE